MRRVASHEDEQAALRAGVFERDRHQDFDEPVEKDLAGYGLRGFGHRPDVQLLEGRVDRAGRGPDRMLAQVRMELLELPNLALGAPAEITVHGVLQIGVSNRLEAARRVEPRGHLM